LWGFLGAALGALEEVFAGPFTGAQGRDAQREAIHGGEELSAAQLEPGELVEGFGASLGVGEHHAEVLAAVIPVLKAPAEAIGAQLPISEPLSELSADAPKGEA
jgi:hypothetical protein